METNGIVFGFGCGVRFRSGYFHASPVKLVGSSGLTSQIWADQLQLNNRFIDMPISAADIPHLPPTGATQAPSDTSDYQRFDEMLVHLTPLGCTVPYNAVYDTEGNIWVAGKGGLFKVCGKKRYMMWSRKNDYPKKQAAFSQVAIYKDTILHATAEDKDKLTELRFFTLEGEQKHEQFIDGLVQSLIVTENGDIFMTKQVTAGGESTVLRSSMDVPLGWDEVVSDDEMAFQALCSYDENTLVAACATMPVNMYSKQCLKWIDVSKNTVSGKFSVEGKGEGQIFFPRKIQKLGENIVLVDKTGRFMKFSRDGKCLGVCAQVDAYMVNGFCLKDEEATMVCSGIMQDEEMKTLCDDWLETIRLDGSSWKCQREEKKRAAAEAQN